MGQVVGYREGVSSLALDTVWRESTGSISFEERATNKKEVTIGSERVI